MKVATATKKKAVKVLCPKCGWTGRRDFGEALIGGYGVCTKCWRSLLLEANP